MRVAALLLLSAVATAGDDGVTAIVDVNVVPMDSERVLEHHTVLVRKGRVAAVGKEVAVPADAFRIDGRGRYLMPGLADMHVHNWYEKEHLLFLANGVTTIRNMWGTPKQLKWRREIGAGTRLGPTLHTTGPILDGARATWPGSTIVTTVEDARAAVRRIRAEGYPSLKIYNGLRRDVYGALVAEARQQGLRVVGHVPRAVGISGALAARQDCIEHLEGYVDLETGERQRIAQETAALGIWNCVTLVVYWSHLRWDELPERPEMKYVPAPLRETWRAMTKRRPDKEHLERLRRLRRRSRELTKALHEAGAKLLLGTDCATPFIIAGWSAHRELRLLVEAGLTPYEALRAGTVDAAAYLGDDFGTVAVGKRADLVLVEANPLEDVRNAARRVGVMVRGRWLPAAELQKRLEASAR
ncbi:MAG: amidohydrolase family protein [Planctomycetota bacterium]